MIFLLNVLSLDDTFAGHAKNLSVARSQYFTVGSVAYSSVFFHITLQ